MPTSAQLSCPEPWRLSSRVQSGTILLSLVPCLVEAGFTDSSWGHHGHSPSTDPLEGLPVTLSQAEQETPEQLCWPHCPQL